MTLNAKIGGLMNFLAISGCDTSLYHSQDFDFAAIVRLHSRLRNLRLLQLSGEAHWAELIWPQRWAGVRA